MCLYVYLYNYIRFWLRPFRWHALSISVCGMYICAYLVHAHVCHVPCDYFGLSYSSFLAHHHPWWESGMLALSLSHCNKIWGREVKESAKARGGTGPERPA